MTTKDKNNIESQLSSLVEAMTAINTKVDGLHENQAKITAELNAKDRARMNPSRVYATNGKNSLYWGTGVATEDIKKGEDISLTLFDAPDSRTGKKAYGFKVRKHVENVENNEDPSTTPEEARDQKQAPVTTEKGELVGA